MSQLDIEIGTIDGFQGREKDVIVMSCVRSGPDGLGFVSGSSNERLVYH